NELALKGRRPSLRTQFRRGPLSCPAVISPRPSVRRVAQKRQQLTLAALSPLSWEKPAAILTLIGDTPLVEVTRIDTGPCHLFLKLENQNPTGSIKDRVALAMVEAAERDGPLAPGGTMIEAAAGHTGLGPALVAAG